MIEKENIQTVETVYEQQVKRGIASQLQADNTVPAQKLTRHLMMQAIKKENPELMYGSNLFKECFVMNALAQEGQNIRRLAEFTGMSKGEIKRHLLTIDIKLRTSM